jgi:2-phospho-L-lactate guanylyltransferase
MGLDGPVPRWTAILPVKDLASAKSRLSETWPARDQIALAFVRDALRALTESGSIEEVLVATSDPRVTEVALDCHASVVDDSHHAGINEAVAWAARQRPTAVALLVVVSDLPALSPGAVDTVLRLAEIHASSFLPDASGTGTTMWCTTDPSHVNTHFGAGSALAHARSGATDLSIGQEHSDALARARRDVDTTEDLEAALALGVGPATAAAVAAAARLD